MKDWLAEHKMPGRVRYYGCPAEEGGAAKAFMVRSGAFDVLHYAGHAFWDSERFVLPVLTYAATGRPAAARMASARPGFERFLERI